MYAFSSHPVLLFFILIFHIHLNVEKSTVAIEKTITHSGFFYDSIVAIKFLQTL